MPLKKRVLLKNGKWALALLDSAAEVTIVCRSLLELLEVKATDDFLQVETADMRVSTPDRVYKVTLELEGDIERTIDEIFWDCVTVKYATGATAPVAQLPLRRLDSEPASSWKPLSRWAGWRSEGDRPPAQRESQNYRRGLSTAER
ncbi:hypothetical protein NDU88_003730 [Pleurodeles waltl]|uniref:Uncharacterized protein n=1 Tax=Pleurodeles waltl TaxID=8319 RepID=A0AAV7WPX0_PLEWA|nr:hypothetical protein NDU88_003730 [Pleurodeles waltl]